MISLSHWGMFEDCRPILLVSSGWLPTEVDLRPGQIIWTKGLPHRCVTVVQPRRG